MTRRWQFQPLPDDRRGGLLTDPHGNTQLVKYLTPAEAKALAQKEQR